MAVHCKTLFSQPTLLLLLLLPDSAAAAEAGINGLNRDSLNTFANLCGIPHSGGASCRRMQRRSARANNSGSSRRSSTRSSRASSRN